MTRCSTGRSTQKYKGGGTDLSDILESEGDIIYADATLSAENLVISGTPGDVLKVSASGIPEWGTSTSQWATSGNDISYITGNVGIGTTSPDATLHVVGNTFVSTDLGLGGTLTMGTVLVEALHELSAITATGNVTPHVIEFTNPTTGFVTTGNVSMGKDLTVAGNVAVDTNTLFVDSVNNRVGIGTSTPQYRLDVGSGGGDVMLRVMNGLASTGKLLFGCTGSADTRSSAIEVRNNGDGGNNYMKFLVHDGGGVSPFEGRTEVMTLRGDGNVGIGTNAPGYPLDVNGAIRYSGTTYNTTLLGSDTVPMKDIKVNSSALPAANWYRIAKNGQALDGQTGGDRCMARFTIVDTKTAQHSYRSFYAGGTFRREPFFHLLSNTSYTDGGVAQKVRIVQSSGSDGEGIGIDVYLDVEPAAGQFQVVMDDNYYPSGYVLVDFEADPDTTGMDVFEYNLDDLMWCVSHDSASSGIFLKKGGNVGIGTATPNYRLDLGGDSSDSRLGFGLNVALDNNRGIYWADDVNYAIYRDDGAWSSPNYAQLRIRFATGIVLDAGGGTYGRSYVGVNDRMAIGSSYYNSNTKPPDNGLLVQGNVAIGTNSDAGHTLNVNGRAFANHLQAYNYFYIYTNIGADAAWRTAFNIGTTAIGFFSVLSNNAGYGQPSAIWWYQYKAGGTSGYVSQISGSTTPTFRLSGQQIQSRGSGQQFVQVRSLPISD